MESIGIDLKSSEACRNMRDFNQSKHNTNGKSNHKKVFDSL